MKVLTENARSSSRTRLGASSSAREFDVHIPRLLADELGERLDANYSEVFGRVRPELGSLLRTAARVVVERLASTDALYHDTNHTILVTMVGQAILKGRLLVEHLTAEDWMHYTVATLVHDIGYLRGICPGDGDGRYVINEQGDTRPLPRGSSDAALAPYHIDRGKIFVRHRFREFAGIDTERIARGIELTRFPVPRDDDHMETGTEPGLVRAADLIGQVANPYYPSRLNALFQELEETGLAAKLGYHSPADLSERYPRFFWSSVAPFVQDAIRHLDRTDEGKTWLAHLYSHVFVEEHRRVRHGPERAHNAEPAGAVTPVPGSDAPAG